MIIRDIDDLFRSVKDERQFEINTGLREIEEQKKLIMSNLSLAYTKKGFDKEAIELDKQIISMDRNFDKSYARLITRYIKLNNIHQAQIYADQLRTLFKPDTVLKYKDILSSFDELLKKSEENVS